MTNKEKYKMAFSALQPSDRLSWEAERMMRLQKQKKMKLAAAIVSGCILIGGTGTAYAANVGGIQRTVQTWIHGDQTSATLEISGDGSYQMNYTDENGEEKTIGGGGVSFGADGSEHPVSEQEILEQLNAPDVEYEADGSIWVYYQNQKIEITDKFDKDGICYVKIKNGGELLYLTVKYQNGFAYSTKCYIEPWAFN